MSFETPSLISLCIQAIKDAILYENGNMSYVYDLPSDLFDEIIPTLPPLALQNLQDAMQSVIYNDVSFSSRNRKSFENFDIAWKNLYESRWSADQKLSIDSLPNTNWHQIYWEKHLQNCLDTTFSKCNLDRVKLPDSLLEYISNESHEGKLRSYSMLTYHCERFGPYARCLRLRGASFFSDIASLLRKSRLESLEICSINSKKQVAELCKLLKQNTKTLKSLEFIDCKLPVNLVIRIYYSLQVNFFTTNTFQNLAIKKSSFLDKSDFPFTLRFKPLLSAISELNSLVLSNNKMCSKIAKLVFDALLETESSLQILDLSENNISGCLSHFKRTNPSCINSYRQVNNSLKFLRVLNLRCNKLQKDDVDCLTDAMVYMPNVEVLNLSDNFLQDDGISMLLPYLVDKSKSVTPLTGLYLENCGLTYNGVIQLFNVLANLKVPLKSLSIADNSLTSNIVSSLGEFLRSGIQSLNVKGIGLGDFVATEEFTRKELSLVCINISGNGSGRGTLGFLTRIISQAPKLVSVDASNNRINIDSLPSICSFIKVANGKLEHLDLRSNPLRQNADVASQLAEYQINGKPNVLLSPP